MAEIAHIFTDGGVIGRNPSDTGGVWAWVQVSRENARLGFALGAVTPAEAGLAKVSNNLTELLAAVEAMEALPAGWNGTIHTDSHCTLRRLVNDRASMKGIPAWLQDRLKAARGRLGGFQVRLLGGHPDDAELGRGARADGARVSSHNVYVDTLCAQAKGRFLRERVEARYRGAQAGA